MNCICGKPRVSYNDPESYAETFGDDLEEMYCSDCMNRSWRFTLIMQKQGLAKPLVYKERTECNRYCGRPHLEGKMWCAECRDKHLANLAENEL